MGDKDPLRTTAKRHRSAGAKQTHGLLQRPRGASSPPSHPSPEGNGGRGRTLHKTLLGSYIDVAVDSSDQASTETDHRVTGSALPGLPNGHSLRAPSLNATKVAPQLSRGAYGRQRGHWDGSVESPGSAVSRNRLTLEALATPVAGTQVVPLFPSGGDVSSARSSHSYRVPITAQTSSLREGEARSADSMEAALSLPDAEPSSAPPTGQSRPMPPFLRHAIVRDYLNNYSEFRHASPTYGNDGVLSNHEVSREEARAALSPSSAAEWSFSVSRGNGSLPPGPAEGSQRHTIDHRYVVSPSPPPSPSIQPLPATSQPPSIGANGAHGGGQHVPLFTRSRRSSDDGAGSSDSNPTSTARHLLELEPSVQSGAYSRSNRTNVGGLSRAPGPRELDSYARMMSGRVDEPSIRSLTAISRSRESNSSSPLVPSRSTVGTQSQDSHVPGMRSSFWRKIKLLTSSTFTRSALEEEQLAKGIPEVEEDLPATHASRRQSSEHTREAEAQVPDGDAAVSGKAPPPARSRSRKRPKRRVGSSVERPTEGTGCAAPIVEDQPSRSKPQLYPLELGESAPAPLSTFEQEGQRHHNGKSPAAALVPPTVVRGGDSCRRGSTDCSGSKIIAMMLSGTGDGNLANTDLGLTIESLTSPHPTIMQGSSMWSAEPLRVAFTDSGRPPRAFGVPLSQPLIKPLASDGSLSDSQKLSAGPPVDHLALGEEGSRVAPLETGHTSSSGCTSSDNFSGSFSLSARGVSRLGDLTLGAVERRRAALQAALRELDMRAETGVRCVSWDDEGGAPAAVPQCRCAGTVVFRHYNLRRAAGCCGGVFVHTPIINPPTIVLTAPESFVEAERPYAAAVTPSWPTVVGSGSEGVGPEPTRTSIKSDSANVQTPSDITGFPSLSVSPVQSILVTSHAAASPAVTNSWSEEGSVRCEPVISSAASLHGKAPVASFVAANGSGYIARSRFTSPAPQRQSHAGITKSATQLSPRAPPSKPSDGSCGPARSSRQHGLLRRRPFLPLIQAVGRGYIERKLGMGPLAAYEAAGKRRRNALKLLSAVIQGYVVRRELSVVLALVSSQTAPYTPDQATHQYSEWETCSKTAGSVIPQTGLNWSCGRQTQASDLAEVQVPETVTSDERVDSCSASGAIDEEKGTMTGGASRGELIMLTHRSENARGQQQTWGLSTKAVAAQHSVSSDLLAKVAAWDAVCTQLPQNTVDEALDEAYALPHFSRDAVTTSDTRAAQNSPRRQSVNSVTQIYRDKEDSDTTNDVPEESSRLVEMPQATACSIKCESEALRLLIRIFKGATTRQRMGQLRLKNMVRNSRWLLHRVWLGYITRVDVCHRISRQDHAREMEAMLKNAYQLRLAIAGGGDGQRNTAQVFFPETHNAAGGGSGSVTPSTSTLGIGICDRSNPSTPKLGSQITSPSAAMEPRPALVGLQREGRKRQARVLLPAETREEMRDNPVLLSSGGVPPAVLMRGASITALVSPPRSPREGRSPRHWDDDSKGTPLMMEVPGPRLATPVIDPVARNEGSLTSPHGSLGHTRSPQGGTLDETNGDAISSGSSQLPPALRHLQGDGTLQAAHGTFGSSGTVTTIGTLTSMAFECQEELREENMAVFSSSGNYDRRLSSLAGGRRMNRLQLAIFTAPHGSTEDIPDAGVTPEEAPNALGGMNGERAAGNAGAQGNARSRLGDGASRWVPRTGARPRLHSPPPPGGLSSVIPLTSPTGQSNETSYSGLWCASVSESAFQSTARSDVIPAMMEEFSAEYTLGATTPRDTLFLEREVSSNLLTTMESECVSQRSVGPTSLLQSSDQCMSPKDALADTQDDNDDPEDNDDEEEDEMNHMAGGDEVHMMKEMLEDGLATDGLKSVWTLVDLNDSERLSDGMVALLQRTGRGFAARKQCSFNRLLSVAWLEIATMSRVVAAFRDRRELGRLYHAVREVDSSISLWSRRNASAIHCQRVIRGFLARQSTTRLQRKLAVRMELRIALEEQEM